MVTLGFPGPQRPTNSNNKATFSELQVQDYDLTLIQANVASYTRNIQTIMSEKDQYVMLAQNETTVSLSTSPIQTPLIVMQTIQDAYETYDLSSGTFTAPQDAVYSVSGTIIAAVTSGTPTALFLDILPSSEGVSIPFGVPLLLSSFFLDVFFPIFLVAGTTLKFFLRTDAAATLNLDPHTRLFVSWK